MTCEQARERLADYSLGFLPDAEGTLIRAHLDVCPDCAECLEGLRRLDASVAEEDLPGDDALVGRVMAVVRARPPRLAPRWLTLLDEAAPVLAVAALLPVALSFVGRLVAHWAPAGSWGPSLAGLLSQPVGLAAFVLASAVVAAGIVWATTQAGEALA
jgi:anti-sigma factor RsiW